MNSLAAGLNKLARVARSARRELGVISLLPLLAFNAYAVERESRESAPEIRESRESAPEINESEGCPNQHVCSALLLDAAVLSADQRERLQIADPNRWWVGIEHQDASDGLIDPRKVRFESASMLLVGFAEPIAGAKSAADPDSITALLKSAAMLAHYPGATRTDFALQSAVQCQHESAQMPLESGVLEGAAAHPSAFVEHALAEVGRANLVLRASHLGSVASLPRDFELQPLAINRWLTRRSAHVKKRAVNPATQRLVNQIVPARWFAALTQLSTWKRNSFSAEVDLARDYIAAQFSALRLNVQTPTFTVPTGGGVQMENVIGTQLGSVLPDEWILVGAHYDSTNISVTNTSNASPGAEDNASGCAGVIEIARVLSHYRFERTIKYLCFGGEEQGLHGSEAYVNGLSVADRGKIKLAVTMDMIGFSSDNRLDVLLETSSALQAVLPPFQQAAADYAPELTVLTSLNPFGSDHIPFINRSVPSLLLIEDEYDTYSHYHRSTDVPANVTNALTQGPAILKTALAVIAERAALLPGEFTDGFE